jgi:mono/diheme cytochrome c family protein
MVLFVLRGFDVITDPAPVLAPVVAPERGPTAAYGGYLVSFRTCRDCHGDALDGVAKAHYPNGVPLLHVRAWTLEQFVTTMRTGINPKGHHLQPPMPWQSYAALDDVELAAIYEYIKSVPLPGTQE